MSNEIILNADLRVRTGTNKTREIRREDSMVPAIIYGNEEESKNIKLKLNELTKASENELFYTQVLKILLEGNEEKVVLKELQREPVKGKFLHADFQRVSRKTKLKVIVPFRFNGEEDCEGVKTDGGVLAKAISEIEIACLAGNIPEAIEIDITNLMLSSLLSGTLTTPRLGSIVQNGKFSAGIDDFVIALNKVDLPTLGNPKIPHLNPILFGMKF